MMLPTILTIVSLGLATDLQPLPGNDRVSVRLLASTSQIEPSKPFQLGIQLRMDPHWHVYWLNPGESGMPTFVDLAGPAGFTFDPVQFPTPESHEMAGEIVNFGYEDTVMFTTTVHPPASFSDQDSRTVTFSADVEWLVCQDVCLPGRKAVSVDVPIAREGRTGRAMYKKQFDAAAAGMPIWPDQRGPIEALNDAISADWDDVSTSSPTMTLPLDGVDEMTFFPLNGDNGFVCDSWTVTKASDDETEMKLRLEVVFDRDMPGENSPSAPKPNDAVGILSVKRGDDSVSYWVPVPDWKGSEPAAEDTTPTPE